VPNDQNYRRIAVVCRKENHQRLANKAVQAELKANEPKRMELKKNV
jgi:hypothetical protein